MENKDEECMALCTLISDVFSKSLKDVFQRELDDPKFMNPTFLGTRFRAFKMMFYAVSKSFKPMYRMLALAIAKHRHDKHMENKTRTMKKLSRKMTHDQIEKATSRGWNS